MKKNFFVVLFLFFTALLFSQSKKKAFHQHEIGLFVGGSYYLGDLNPRKHFYMTRPAFGAFYRYAWNYRGALRIGFFWGQVEGDDSQSENKDQIERNLNFKSSIQEFHAITEFNFYDYRIGNDKHFFTLFLFAGVGVFHFNPLGNLGGNSWVELRPLKTEGQSKVYPLWRVNIPFGIGIKINVAKNIGLGLEWGPRVTFTDYLDDISDKYPDLKTNPPKGNIGALMSNRTSYPWNFISGYSRGNPGTKDWYFFTGLTINIKLVSKQPCYATGM